MLGCLKIGDGLQPAMLVTHDDDEDESAFEPAKSWSDQP